jgi:hypothetical protein
MGRRHAENIAGLTEGRLVAVTDADRVTRQRVVKDLVDAASGAVLN